jgi:hypothetical protein
MLIRLMRELGRLLAKQWAEQASCASGRDFDRDTAPRACGRVVVSGQRDAVAG